MKTALVILHSGFEEIEAVAPIDILRRAGIQVTTVSLTADKVVRGAQGISVTADESLSHLKYDTFDCVILPGGAGFVHSMNEPAVLEIVKRHITEENKFVAAICAAPCILDKAGILPKNYTAHFSVGETLPEIQDLAVVQEQKIITSQGPATAVDFALKIVENLIDAETAQSISEGICRKASKAYNENC